MNAVRRHLLALGLSFAAHTPMLAQDAVPFEGIRALMVSAIDAPNGQARGTLVGPLGDAVRTRFNASGPIGVEVSTVKRYAQHGCRRLNVRFRQDGVNLPGAGAPRPQTIDFGINYCRDGAAPASLR
jgi:hypothetical protein